MTVCVYAACGEGKLPVEASGADVCDIHIRFYSLFVLLVYGLCYQPEGSGQFIGQLRCASECPILGLFCSALP